MIETPIAVSNDQFSLTLEGHRFSLQWPITLSNTDGLEAIRGFLGHIEALTSSNWQPQHNWDRAIMRVPESSDSSWWESDLPISKLFDGSLEEIIEERNPDVVDIHSYDAKISFGLERHKRRVLYVCGSRDLSEPMAPLIARTHRSPLDNIWVPKLEEVLRGILSPRYPALG